MDGLVDIKGYKFWHHVGLVKDAVWDFLEKMFPNSVIFPEFFGADLVILKENIPVEIQSTIILKKSLGKRIAIGHSLFEQLIEKQIKQNIDNFGICWFFFDSEYLRYLQNEITRGARINLDWLYQFMKDNVLRVFTVRYDGVIREISCKDLGFLTNVSMTCKIGQDEDFRILDRNKFKIMANVLKGYNFTSDELFRYREDFSKSDGQNFNIWLSREGRSNREKLLGTVLNCITTLNIINQILDFNEEIELSKNHRYYLTTLGLFDVKGNTVSAIYCFTDKFEIADYFPGYVRNKEIWDTSREKYVKLSTLRKLVQRQISIKDVDTQKEDKYFKINKEIKNKLYIIYDISDEEINKYKIEFEKDNYDQSFMHWLQKRGTSERQKLLGRILEYGSRSQFVEDFFARNEDQSNFKRLKPTLVLFGIIKSTKGGRNSITQFVDIYNLGHLFDGYNKNKEFWMSIRGAEYNYYEFWSMVYNKSDM